MIKTGIYTLEQLDDPANFKSIFGADKRISITLYDKVIAQLNSEELAERILLMFTDDRGAYKRTYANRFETFDLQVLNYLQQQFTPEQMITFHDVGVSDGRTSVDFFTKIIMRLPNVHYTASDYNPKVYVIEQNELKVTVSQSCKVIEIVYPPFVFNAARPDRYWYEPLNRLLQTFIEFTMVTPLLKKYNSGDIQKKEILLFCPRALELAKSNSGFKLAQYDILTDFPHKQNVIRAMNVFNSTYFSRSEFISILRNIHTGLHNNGFLITGSNQNSDSDVHGGIFQKKGDGFVNILKSGTGSPIQELIDNFTMRSYN